MTGSTSGSRAAQAAAQFAPRDPQGQIVFEVGPEVVTGDPPDLPTQGAGALLLTLRLYNPALSLQRDPGSLAAPRIDVVGSCP